MFPSQPSSLNTRQSRRHLIKNPPQFPVPGPSKNRTLITTNSIESLNMNNTMISARPNMVRGKQFHPPNNPGSFPPSRGQNQGYGGEPWKQGNNFSERKYIHAPETQKNDQFSSKAGPYNMKPEQTWNKNTEHDIHSYQNSYENHGNNQPPQSDPYHSYNESRRGRQPRQPPQQRPPPVPYNTPPFHPPNSGPQYCEYDGDPYTEEQVPHSRITSSAAPSYNPGYTTKEPEYTQFGYNKPPYQEPRESSRYGSDHPVRHEFPGQPDREYNSGYHSTKPEYYPDQRSGPSGGPNFRQPAPNTGAPTGEIQSILNSMKGQGLNPLLSKPSSTHDDSPGVGVSDFLKNQIREVAKQLIEEKGLAETMDLVGINKSKNRSVSPLKITTRRRRTRSRSRSPKRSSSDRRRSRDRTSSRHGKRSRRSRSRERGRKNRKSSETGAPDLENDTIKRIMEDKYPKLAATLGTGGVGGPISVLSQLAPLPPPPPVMPGLLPHPSTLPFGGGPPFAPSFAQYPNVVNSPTYSPLQSTAMLPPPSTKPLTGPMPNRQKKGSNENDKLRCKPCNLNFKTKKPFLDHIDTGLHQKRFKAYVKDSAARSKKKVSHCESCHLVFNSELQLANHKIGEIHLTVSSRAGMSLEEAGAKQQEAYPAINWNLIKVADKEHKSDEEEFAKTFCYTCRIKFNCSSLLAEHKETKKHAVRVVELELTPHPPPQQFCHVCNMWFPNALHLNNHTMLHWHKKTLTIFTKFGIPVPGIDSPVNPRRNMTIVINDEAAPTAPTAPEFVVPKVPPLKKKETKEQPKALSNIQAYNDSESDKSISSEDEKSDEPEPPPPGTLEAEEKTVISLKEKEGIVVKVLLM